MKKNKNLYRKGWSIATIALITSVIVAPIIYAREYKQDDLIEITTEFCGLGKKYVKKLTIKQAKELDNHLTDIRKTFLKADSQEESVQILKDGLRKINKFNLFANIGSDRTIELIEKKLKKEKDQRSLRDLNFDNSLCLIFGGLSGDYFITTPLSLSLAIFFDYLVFQSKQLGLEKLHAIATLSFYSFAFLWIYLLANKPINILANYNEFVPYPYGLSKEADILSIGKNGKIHFNYVESIIGFTGIKLINPVGEYNQILFGYALGIKEF